MSLPQLTSAQPFVADGGLETRLVFQDGIDLPEFAAFPLLADDAGRARLTNYFAPYLDVAARHGVGIVLDTPTWRANLDWGARLGFDADEVAAFNARGLQLVDELRRSRPDLTAVTNGVVGPRGDGYVVEALMTVGEASAYHGHQVSALAEAGVDMVSAVTMTTAAEAAGFADAAQAVGLPAVVSFTVETDGRLPSGQALGAAIEQVDDVTGGAPAYYMINCAHPTHFVSALDRGSAWLGRVRAVRANASRRSHAELDAAPELDRGDISELANLYAELATILDLSVVGGCCGTDHEHVAAIAAAVVR